MKGRRDEGQENEKKDVENGRREKTRRNFAEDRTVSPKIENKLEVFCFRIISVLEKLLHDLCGKRIKSTRSVRTDHPRRFTKLTYAKRSFRRVVISSALSKGTPCRSTWWHSWAGSGTLLTFDVAVCKDSLMGRDIVLYWYTWFLFFGLATRTLRTVDSFEAKNFFCYNFTLQ